MLKQFELKIAGIVGTQTRKHLIRPHCRSIGCQTEIKDVNTEISYQRTKAQKRMLNCYDSHVIVIILGISTLMIQGR